MLIAEIHGKVVPETQGDEDQLTSAVFGHLRYISPGRFWAAFFGQAMSLGINGQCLSVAQVAAENGRSIESFETIEIHFWPNYRGLGRPDMAICFTGRNQKPLLVLVEVKLYSPIGGIGEHNQLVRYLKIMDDIRRLQAPIPDEALALVVYLTRKEAISDVQDSLAIYGDSPENRRRLFRLQWQDVYQVIGDILRDWNSHSPCESPMVRRILIDVGEFLRRRGLSYFNGFRPIADLDSIRYVHGSFFEPEAIFQGFRLVAGMPDVRVVRGGWCNGN